YSLEGVHYGTTYVYIETADGKIRTQRIKVVVDKETVTTTEPLTLRSYSYTGEDYYPSTSSTKSTDDEDENETTSETKTNSYTDKPEFSTSDNSEYTPPTVPPTAPPTEPPPTQPPVTVPPTAIVEPQE
ncbi:MAG: hypothetical protein KBT46_05360, partial [Ruminococcus sp.]|nr:hypothetical protein [Candidatus Copronaster equi]